MTTTKPGLVSVIITVYNDALHLGEAIESVLTQTYGSVELIVVDDGSTDGSDEVAKGYRDSLRYVFQERGGIGSARNRAVALAEGEFLAFLDADDRYVPDKLERQVGVLNADPSLDMVFGHITEFVDPDADEETRGLLRPPLHDVPWRMTNLMLVRRGAFLRAGLFSTDLRVAVGVDWYTRAKEAGLKEAVLPVIVLERRLHAGNNGLRQKDSRHQYLHVLKRSIDRRRGTDAEPGRPEFPADAAT